MNYVSIPLVLVIQHVKVPLQQFAYEFLIATKDHATIPSAELFLFKLTYMLQFLPLNSLYMVHDNLTYMVFFLLRQKS